MKIFFSSRLFFLLAEVVVIFVVKQFNRKNLWKNGLWKWFLHHTQAILIPAKCVVLLRNGKSNTELKRFFLLLLFEPTFFLFFVLLYPNEISRKFLKCCGCWCLTKTFYYGMTKRIIENEEIIWFCQWWWRIEKKSAQRASGEIITNFQRQCKRIERTYSSLLMNTFFFRNFIAVRTKIICSISIFKFTCLETISNKTELSSRNRTMKWISCEMQNKLWNYGNDWLLS